MYIRQFTQVSGSDSYDDTFSPGIGLQTASYNLENDLNAIRSQIKNILYSTSSGKWYDDLQVFGTKRGLQQIGSDLNTLQNRKLVYLAEQDTDIAVPAAQNWVVLSSASTQVPTFPAATSSAATGSIVSVLPGNVGAFSLLLISGTNLLAPKNLVTVVSSSNGNKIQASTGEDIYGLLQAELGTADGNAFNDTTKQVQISFVVPNATRTGWSAASSADIAGKSINYSYPVRTTLDFIPEDAFHQGDFVDTPYTTSNTLDGAIDNQVGPVTQTDRSIQVRITAPFSWSFTTVDGSRNVGEFANTYAKFNIDDFTVQNTNTATVLNGLRTAVSGNWVELSSGFVKGSGSLILNSLNGNLIMSSSQAAITFVDTYKTGSTYTGNFNLANATSDYSNFVTSFGQVSLLNSLNQLSSSITSSRGQTRYDSVVTSVLVTAGTNVTSPTNLDAALGNYSAYSGAQFVSGVNIYYNGILLRNGTTSTNDVYPGTTPANGDLKFTFSLRINDVITMIIPN
jgi:hypothetical protein